MNTLNEIGNLLRTQDNRATAHPMFIVEERERIWGVSQDYTDLSAWIDEEGNEASSSIHERLELGAPVQNGRIYEKVGYIERWKFITACFTERGCEDFIRANLHNLIYPRIRAASAYRNAEFISVREFLMGLPENSTTDEQ